MTLTKTRPEWWTNLPAERQGLWSVGDSKFALAGQTLSHFPMRIILKDGSILDGTMGAERNRWDPKHAVGLRMEGRKTLKWIPRVDIAVVWADRGPSAVDLLGAFLKSARG